MRVALIVNGAAGSMDGEATADAIRAHLAAAGIAAAPEPDAALPLRARIAAAAREPGLDALVVAGGDGTIACAASVLAGRALPLRLLPLGTMNLLARDLGLPLDLAGAVETVASGEPRRIDVGEVESDGGSEVFLISSVLGMPARMARHREAQRGREGVSGALRMAAGLVRHLGRYPRVKATVGIGGVARTWRFRALAVVDNDYDEAPGRVPTRSSVDAGHLTVYVLPHASPWTMLRLGAGFAAGSWRRLPGLERHRAEALTIDAGARSLRVMNDGEVRLLASPLRYRIHRRALAVMVPRTGR